MESRGVATAARNQQIVEIYSKGGTTLRQLAAEHHVSAERIRQVLERAGISSKSIRNARKRVRAQQRRERQTLQRYGVSQARFDQMQDLGIAMRLEGCSKDRTLIRMFEADRRRARRNGEDWRLSLDDYVNAWLDSGRLNVNGRGDGPRYALARLDEATPWDFDNTIIEAETATPKRGTAKMPRKYLGLPQGVRQEGKRFVAVLRTHGRYKRFGPFDTPEEAAAAYETARSWGDGSRGVTASALAFM